MGKYTQLNKHSQLLQVLLPAMTSSFELEDISGTRE
jgi:hypothetical protein